MTTKALQPLPCARSAATDKGDRLETGAERKEGGDGGNPPWKAAKGYPLALQRASTARAGAHPVNASTAREYRVRPQPGESRGIISRPEKQNQRYYVNNLQG